MVVLTWELSFDFNHMDIPDQHTEVEKHNEKLEKYYRFHSGIYDWTRWSFLFGREELLNGLPELPPDPRILEIGCGTGKNITHLEYLFADGRIHGIDLSREMIQKAQKKIGNEDHITLIHGAYGEESFNFEPFDLILLSYSLTMLDDRIEQVLQRICSDLRPDGYIAVVDFHSSPFRWFRDWMKANHVDLSGYLPTLLNKFFTPSRQEKHKAYFGLWSYFLFIGRSR